MTTNSLIISAFLGFPTWYEYLPKNSSDNNAPMINGLNDVWLIVAAVIEILLRLAAIIAVGMIIYAGFRFITSQGDPEDTRQARGAIINALIGLFITVIAAIVVNFIARKIA